MTRPIRRLLVAIVLVGAGVAAAGAPPVPVAAAGVPRTTPALPIAGAAASGAASGASAAAPSAAASGPQPTLADVVRHQQRAAVSQCRAATLEKKLQAEIGADTAPADYLAAHADARDARSRRIKRLIAEVEALSSDNVRLYHEQVTMRGALSPGERQQMRDLERRLAERCRA